MRHVFYSIILCILGISLANCSDKQEVVLKTSYSTPAVEWESEALPIGNGHLGAMIFGGVGEDIIQLNEHTLWSGGPGKNPDYNGGHRGTPEANKQNLQSLRKALQEKMTSFTENDAAYIDKNGNVIAKDYPPENEQLKAYIESLMGTREDFGSYQELSRIVISDIHKDELAEYTGYRRELNIDESISTVVYSQGGVQYRREYFADHPDNVIVIRLSADKPGQLSKAIGLTTPQVNSTITATEGLIKLTGKPADHSDEGLKFAQYMYVIPQGGTISTVNNNVQVEHADEILIITTAATNYRQCMDDSFDFFSGINPEEKAEATIDRAKSKSFDELYASHLQDYKSLYDRMAIRLPNAVNTNNKTTDKLLEGYIAGTNTEAENRYLEMVYYQFGRYLLISSSRPGGLPANLQGIWAEGLLPPWCADYHTNINVQMNYWPAEQTNLSECHLPLIDYTKSLVPRGRITAQHYYCKPDGSPVRGWVIHHENNIWAHTAPGDWYTAFYFPAAGGWMCQHIWEHYLFTQDRAFLEEYYPVLLDAALFWVDNLWEDSRDGTLVANPSYSPEHGPYSLGTSSDQAIICELFDMTIKAAGELNKHSSEMEEIRLAKDKLAGPQIGLGGQFMEWKDELLLDITGDDKHRHANHLFWLHPGSQIVPGRSAEDDRYAEAMKQTLNTRTDEGTGWSKAWKINFRARLKDGNRSHKLLQEQLKYSTLANLFDTHPPFQIDGNFGATAGMTEMLVQSQADWIELLPALPDVWATGSFEGIKARGNFELDAEWKDKQLNTVTILSRSGKECILKYHGIKNCKLNSNRKNIEFTIIDDNVISFPTEIGQSYTMDF